MSEPCPSQERWREHLDGILPPSEQALLTEHLDHCADCRNTLETLAGGTDSLLAVARRAGEKTAESSPALEQVLGQWEAPATAETKAEVGGDQEDWLSFLSPSAKPGHLGQLGHYDILEVLGKGGFGVVLKGFDERLHRIVAIKVLSPAFAANGAARLRFIREARAAAAVKNEHVVGIYDVQEKANPPYLVMECVDGVSLQDKINKQGPLGVTETLRIGMQIAEGLAAAHKQGKIHRDIKPANILLENGVERVKITDFGLARAVDDASVTQSGTVAGTPMYMSPEQAEGIPIDSRSDLFSLGTVLYAMCTGHPPFRASGTHAVLKRVIDASPRPIREFNNEIPDWLCDIIAKLHAKKPEDRFQTAKEVAELLGQRLADVQAGRAVAGEPSRVSDRVEAPAPSSALAETKEAAHGFVTGLALFALVFVPFFLVYYAWFHLAEAAFGLSGKTSILLSAAVTGTLAIVLWLASTQFSTAGRARKRLATMAGVLALVSFTFAITGIRTSGQPVVMVDSNDPDVEVTITSDQDGPDGKRPLLPLHETAMPPGKYHVYVHAGEGRLIESISIREWGQTRPFPGGIKENTLELELERGQRFTLVIKTSPSEATVNLGKPFFFDHVNLDKVVIRSIEMVDGKIQKEGPQVAALKHEPAFVKQAKTTTQAKLVPGMYKLEFVCRPGCNVSKLELVNERTGQKSLAALQPKDAANYWRPLDLKPGDEITIQVAVEKTAEPGPAVTDEQRLRGTWRAVLMSENGGPLQKLPAGTADAFTYDGQKAVLETFGREKKVEGILSLDATQNPRRISLTTFGQKVAAQVGIYRLEKDRFELCANVRPTKLVYPTKFETVPGGPLIWWVFERVAPAPGWVPLFNGKDLDGWTQDGTPNWKVRDGVLFGEGKGRLYTNRDFRDFHCRVQLKTTGDALGDFGFRRTAKEYANVRVGGPRGKEQRGSLHCFNPLGVDEANAIEERGLVPADTWFDLEVIVRGKHVIVLVNGVKTSDATLESLADAGQFYFYCATSKGAIHIRKIEIKELPPAAVAPFDEKRAKAHQEAWARYLGVDVEITNAIGMKLRLIPPGEFTMGSSPEEIKRAVANVPPIHYKNQPKDEGPARRVRIDAPCYLGVHEVTVGEFRKFVKDTGYRTGPETDGLGSWGMTGKEAERSPKFTWKAPEFVTSDKLPVVCIEYADAQAFCAWLSRIDGRRYEIPHESVWEYACRAGTTGLWPWGDRPEDFDEHASWDRHIVGRNPANAFGLCDMIGNVAEFARADDEPYVIRGGGGHPSPWLNRPAYRVCNWWQNYKSGFANGFRVAIVGDLKGKTPSAAIDLMPMARPDSKTGTWKREGNTLVSIPMPAKEKKRFISKLPIHRELPREFVLEAVIERLAGDDAFSFIIPAFGTDFMVTLDGFPWKGFYSGLSFIDGKLYPDTETAVRGQQLVNGKKSTVRVTVRTSGVTTELDGKKLFDYRGGYAKIESKRRECAGSKFFVQIVDSPYRLHALRLIPLAEEPGWVQLFNRKDMKGWHVSKQHAPGLWKVDDGIF